MRDAARIHLPFPLFGLALIYEELGAAERARRVVGTAAALADVEATHPSWREAALVAQLHLAWLYRDRKRLNDLLDKILRLPSGLFIPDDAEFILSVGEALLETGRIDELQGVMRKRRPETEKFGAPHHLAALDILDALLAIRKGRPAEALGWLHHGLRMSQEAGDVITQRRLLELRLGLENSPEDRRELRSLLQRVAASLPEGLRATFLASPRVAPNHGRARAFSEGQGPGEYLDTQKEETGDACPPWETTSRGSLSRRSTLGAGLAADHRGVPDTRSRRLASAALDQKNGCVTQCESMPSGGLTNSRPRHW